MTLSCPAVYGWEREQVTPDLGSWSGWRSCQVQLLSLVGRGVSQGYEAVHLPGSLLTQSLCHFPILCWLCFCCCDLFPIRGCGFNPWLVAVDSACGDNPMGVNRPL